MDLGAIVRAVVVVFLLAFAPGRAWVHLLLPGLRNPLERVTMSILLSVAMLMLAVYFGNLLFQVPVSGTTAIWYALSLTMAGLAIPLASDVDAAFNEALRAAQARVLVPNGPARPR